jgi:hypothetical protein
MSTEVQAAQTTTAPVNWTNIAAIGAIAAITIAALAFTQSQNAFIVAVGAVAGIAGFTLPALQVKVNN